MTIELSDYEAEITYGSVLVVSCMFREKSDKTDDEVEAALALQNVVRSLESAFTPEQLTKFRGDAIASGLL
jgi:hypothetical protein